MKIGIDCRTILDPGRGEQAGIGHYTHYLIKNLIKLDSTNQYVLFFDSRYQKTKQYQAPNVKIKYFPFYQYKTYLPITYSQMLMSAFLGQEKLDVYHSPANTLPLPYNRPSVITIHNLAVYKYPKFFPAQLLSREGFSNKILLPQSLKKAHKIIANSKSTKKDIIEEFGIEEDKIEVVYLGVLKAGQREEVDFEAVKAKYGLGNKYFLFLGTIEPRKNLVTLVKAFRNLKMEYDTPAQDCQLVLAGAPGWKDKPVYQEITNANAAIIGSDNKRSGRERRSGFDTRSDKQKQKQGERRKTGDRRNNQPVKHIGYVTHQEKIALLKNAVGFVFPSWYEGFGLPIIEAMSFGIPVITSNLSSMPEVVGEKNALLVNPGKESDIVDAMTQILTDEGLREELSINGVKRAGDFTWDKCAERTLKVYQQVYQGTK